MLPLLIIYIRQLAPWAGVHRHRDKLRYYSWTWARNRSDKQYDFYNVKLVTSRFVHDIQPCIRLSWALAGAHNHRIRKQNIR
jgi:hypothetical protein